MLRNRWCVCLIAEAIAYLNITVEDIADDAETKVHKRNIQRLSTHQRILLDIVREDGGVAVGELHEAYEERAPKPKSKPNRRRYLQSLERYE